MRNYKLILEYDGTDFSGFQVQPRVRTVQGELQKALTQLFGSDFCLAAAGRTDAGVHARGQVVNVRAEKEFPPAVLQRALNAHLPEDIVVKEAVSVPLDFHARFSACRRRYAYQISRQPTALARRFVWHLPFAVEENRLHACAEIVRKHTDFQSFTKTGAEVTSHICHIKEARWEISETRLVFHISANRFLHNMVRILVGTMIEVARGRFTVEEFEAMFDVRDRRAAGLTAPAKGLILEEVTYWCSEESKQRNPQENEML
jgi:tRNA pseudouridine38-40 synthase